MKHSEHSDTFAIKHVLVHCTVIGHTHILVVIKGYFFVIVTRLCKCLTMSNYQIPSFEQLLIFLMEQSEPDQQKSEMQQNNLTTPPTQYNCQDTSCWQLGISP